MKRIVIGRGHPIENKQDSLVSSEKLVTRGYDELRVSSGQPTCRPVFVGNAREFFRIWVVNLLFSLLTLGIWSAWATVRNRRYLFGNTEFAGNHFDFHGNPLAILRGRILAVALFTAYALGGDFYFAIPVIAIVLLIVLFPWLLTSAMRFRLGNTSWRNLRFGFSASYKHAFGQLGFPMSLVLIAYLLFVIQFQWLGLDNTDMDSLKRFGMASLFFLLISFILTPLVMHRIQDVLINHTRYGEHDFNAQLRLLRFAGFYGRSFLIGVIAILLNYLAVFLVFTLMGGLNEVVNSMSSGNLGFMFLVYFFLVPAYLLPYAVWKVATTNYVLSETHLGGLDLKMNMGVWAYWWVLVTNAYLAAISLGLAIPWAKIRMIRYKLSCLSVQGDIPVYRGTNVGRQNATGDQIGEAFDIEFGF